MKGHKICERFIDDVLHIAVLQKDRAFGQVFGLPALQIADSHIDVHFKRPLLSTIPN